jgi:glycosyltransferase involved in cell wall biosynthesis
VKVDVCIVTYRRPRGLLRLLGALQELRFAAPPPDLRIVVVDNDEQESARPVCEEAESWLAWPLVYAVEKRRGIPQARNTAVALALERADFVAFVDDDEAPDPDWLAELLRVQRSRHADAVAGPCLPAFEAPPPAWIERGGFFERPRHATGTRIDYAFTHNVLVSTRALTDMPTLFDERMALTGGSDSEFFARFVEWGHRIVWADAAVVSEWVPASRARLGWLLRRAFRVGTASTWIECQHRPGPRAGLRSLLLAGRCLAKATLLLLAAPLRGRAAAGHALRLAADGAGRLAGLGGLRYAEYRLPHGR